MGRRYGKIESKSGSDNIHFYNRDNNGNMPILAIFIGVVFPAGAIISGAVYGYYPKKRFIYKAGIIILLTAIMTLVVLYKL